MVAKKLREKISDSSKTGILIAGIVLTAVAVSLGTVLILNLLKAEKKNETPQPEEPQGK